MRAFLIAVLIVFDGILCFTYAREAAQNELAQKQIAGLTQRLAAVEAQEQNLATLRSDMRTLNVKIDALRGALRDDSTSQTTSLQNEPGSTPVQPVGTSPQ